MKNNFKRIILKLVYSLCLEIFLLLSQRDSFVTVKFFDPEISMILDISELPESKYIKKNVEESKLIFVADGFGYRWEVGPFSERPENSLSIHIFIGLIG